MKPPSGGRANPGPNPTAHPAGVWERKPCARGDPARTAARPSRPSQSHRQPDRPRRHRRDARPRRHRRHADTTNSTWTWTEQHLSRPSISPGESSELTVLVKTAAAEPVGNRPVDIYKMTESGWVRIATQTTNAWGWTAPLHVADSTDTTYTAVGLPGDGFAQSKAEDIVLDVRDTSGVIEVAKRYLGRPYRWGASGPSAFDCSGFTSYVMRQFGISLPHNAAAQSRVARRVSMAAAQPGDLVFAYNGSGRVYHVGIYAGNNQMIAAPNSGDVVKVQPIYTSRIWIGRVF